MKRTGCFGGVQGLNILAALVRNKIAAVLLGPAGLGLMSLYNTAVKLFGDSLNLGIPMSAVKFVSESETDGQRSTVVSTIRFWSLLTAIAAAVLCCALSPLVSYFYFDTSARWAEFVWLSPVCAFTILTSGELAILKGLQRLRAVATQSVVNAFLCLVVTLPFFWALGSDGILPAVIAAAVVALGSVAWFSLKAAPYRLPLSFREAFASGRGLVGLGVAFLLAGVMGAGVEFVIRAFIANSGSVADVGLYNAAYVITVTYASVVFMAMETDYFPRLSAVNHDTAECNAVVNRQIEVSVLLLAPLLVAFLLALPIVVPMLYSSKFLPAIGMVRLGVVAMLFRAVLLPMEYMSLAKGRSWIYLLTEGCYDVAAVVAVVLGYRFLGIEGAGLGLLAAAVFNLILDWCVCRHYYKYAIARKAAVSFAVQLVPVVATYFVATWCEGWSLWILGLLCLVWSAVYSFRRLEREAGLADAIKAKFKR